MLKQVQKFLQDEEGISSIEYALIAVAIALVVFVAATPIGENLTTTFNNVADAIVGG